MTVFAPNCAPSGTPTSKSWPRRPAARCQIGLRPAWCRFAWQTAPTPPPPPLGSASERYCLACARPPPPNLSHEADVLQWVMAERGVLPVDRGLDAASSPCRGLAGSSSPECEGNLARIPAVCDDLRVQLAADKLEGPSECLMFIGIDTKAGLVPFPTDKLGGLKALLARWYHGDPVAADLRLCLVSEGCGQSQASPRFRANYSAAPSLATQHYLQELSDVERRCFGPEQRCVSWPFRAGEQCLYLTR